MSLTHWSEETSAGSPGLAEWVTLAHALRAARDLADPNTLAAIAGRGLRERLGAREYRVLLLDPRTGALDALDETSHRSPFRAAPDGAVERAIASREPVFHATGSAACEPGLWAAPPQLEVAMPLVAGGEVRGLLLLAFDAGREWTAGERALVQSLGDVLAAAFERAALRSEARNEREAREELARRLEEESDSTSYLLSMVACEIRSPLSSIQAYAEMLIETLGEPQAPRERFLAVIHEECQRLNRAVTDLLDLSRLETGMRPLRLVTIDPDALVADAIEALRPAARARQVAIDVAVEDSFTVEADPDLVLRLLRGLIANAIQYSPRSGFVRVSAQKDGDDWMLVVQDQGPPIAAADLPRAFERFFRARPQGAESPATGLGLAIAQGIVEAHGGSISAESTEPAGVRLTARLPVRQVLSPRARRLGRRLLGRAAVQELLRQAIVRSGEIAEAGAVSLMVIDPERGDYVVTATHGSGAVAPLGRRATLRASVAGIVAASGRGLAVANIETDPRFQKLSHPQYTSKSLLCVPVVVCGEVLAVINATDPGAGRPFDEIDLQKVTAYAGTIAARIEGIAAGPEDEVPCVASGSSSSRDAGERDPSVHADPVALTRAVASELGMSAREAELLAYVASLLHAREPAGSTEAERADGPNPVSEVVRTQDYLTRAGHLMVARHEHWDGTGHPLGLAGDAIPAGSRVLAVVSVYASLAGEFASDAPGGDAALQAIREQADRRFDPGVVDALARAIGVAEDAR